MMKLRDKRRRVSPRGPDNVVYIYYHVYIIKLREKRMSCKPMKRRIPMSSKPMKRRVCRLSQ